MNHRSDPGIPTGSKEDPHIAFLLRKLEEEIPDERKGATIELVNSARKKQNDDFIRKMLADQYGIVR